ALVDVPMPTGARLSRHPGILRLTATLTATETVAPERGRLVTRPQPGFDRTRRGNLLPLLIRGFGVRVPGGAPSMTRPASSSANGLRRRLNNRHRTRTKANRTAPLLDLVIAHLL